MRSITPLPDSEDHRKLFVKGAWVMDPDLNKYDLSHAVSHHPTMSRAEWEEVRHEAWISFYSPGHLEMVMRRGEALGINYGRTREGLVFFRHCVLREEVHPVDSGLVRLKRRRDRRPELERENPFVFYPRFWWETARKTSGIAWDWVTYGALGRRIAADPAKASYLDTSIAPDTAADDETLELLTRDASTRAAVRHYRSVQRLTT